MSWEVIWDAPVLEHIVPGSRVAPLAVLVEPQLHHFGMVADRPKRNWKPLGVVVSRIVQGIVGARLDRIAGECAMDPAGPSSTLGDSTAQGVESSGRSPRGAVTGEEIRGDVGDGG